MRTDDLIQDLVADVRPVRRLPGVDQRSLRWMIYAFLFIAAGAMSWGLRSDLAEKAHQALFVIENGLLLLVFALAARSAFRLSVPGDEHPVTTLALPLLAFLLWFTFLVVRYSLGWGPGSFALDIRPGFLCIWRILTLGTLPAAACYILLRQAAPLNQGWAGFFVSLSAFSVAAMGTKTLCVIDWPLHVLLWHCLPVFLIGLLGASLGRLAFRTYRSKY